MPFTLTMPKLSPTMDVGTIAKWHKKEGDKVEAGDLLIEVATDKATVEHNAIDEGFLRKILVKEGEDADVNQAIAVFTESKDENIEDYKPEGEKVEEPQKDLDEEKPKKTVKKSEKGTLQRTQPEMAQPKFVPEPPLDDYSFDFPTSSLEERIKASPLAKKIAEQKNLDLSSIKGTGPDGRIMERDLEKAASKGEVSFTKRRSVPGIKPGTYEEEKMSQMRKVISERLQQAKTFIPHFYVRQTVQADKLFSLREQLRNLGIKVSFNDCVVKACALALNEYPDVNSGFNTENNTLIRFKTIDISVAVGFSEGLITPIVRLAYYKNLAEISAEIRSLAKRAKEGRLELHEFKGGSFTVSNLGMYGVTDFSAIINPPQAAALAVGGINNVPIVKDGKVVPGKVMNITLSADHRVVDGVLAAQFIKCVQKYLENPVSLML